MKLNKIILKNFRNCDYSQLEFKEGINFIYGNNGEGKTSVLEALSLLTTLRSFKTKNLIEIISYEKNSLEISAEIEASQLIHKSKIIFTKKDQKLNKEIFLNEKLMRTSSQYLNTRYGSIETAFHSICFNPSDHELVNGDPIQRRSYLDRVLSAESKSYYESLSRFKKALESRNYILKNGKGIQSLDAFTEVFIEEGAKLTQWRLNWIQKINQTLEPFSKKIAENSNKIEIKLISKWLFSPEKESEYFTLQEGPERIKFCKNRMLSCLIDTKHLEKEAKTTLVGPQRDDWFFKFGNHSLKSVGSQGEVRTALLALKLSEIEMYQKNTEGNPLFLLDDFSSELDGERRKALIQYLKETPLQVFITSTEIPKDLKIDKIFKIEKGILIEQ